MSETMSADGVGEMTFEDALSQLESIVSELERGETPLEQTIARFERGIALSRRCEDRLNEADRKVAILLREGSQVVEVDMQSGARLEVHQDPGEPAPSPTPREAPPRPAPVSPAPERSAAPRPPDPTPSDGPPMPPPRGDVRLESGRPPETARKPEGQMSLDQSFAVKDSQEMDDDDIPF